MPTIKRPPITEAEAATIRELYDKATFAQIADILHRPLLDALVHAGMLIDDRKECVELGPVTFERGARADTVVRLEDC